MSREVRVKSQAIQHMAYFLIEINADSSQSICLLVPLLALLAYPDEEYPDYDAD